LNTALKMVGELRGPRCQSWPTELGPRVKEQHLAKLDLLGGDRVAIADMIGGTLRDGLKEHLGPLEHRVLGGDGATAKSEQGGGGE
jgi:hypothetical protein